MKKINIGVVLTIITLLIVIIYNVKLENKRKVDKQEIETLCREYIDFACKYAMLEEKYRTMPKTIKDDEYSKYLGSMKNELKNFIIPNDEYLNNQYENLKKVLDKQVVDNDCVITSVEKTNFKIKEYTFTNNKAEVIISDSVVAKYLIETKQDGQTKITEQNENRYVTDKMILEEVNGIWKVSFANLEYVSPFTEIYFIL